MNGKTMYTIVVMALVVIALSCVLPGPISGYESKGKRDPFVPLIGQDRGSRPVGLEGIVSVNDLFLEGVAIGPSGKNIAILNGQMVKEKDKFGLLRIKKIAKTTVELSLDGKIHILSLKDEEGIKIGK